MNDSCEMMSKYKLRIRREKRTKITQNDTTKNREEEKKKKKNCGADLYDDYGYSKKLLGL